MKVKLSSRAYNVVRNYYWDDNEVAARDWPGEPVELDGNLLTRLSWTDWRRQPNCGQRTLEEFAIQLKRHGIYLDGDSGWRRNLSEHDIQKLNEFAFSIANAFCSELPTNERVVIHGKLVNSIKAIIGHAKSLTQH